MIDLEDYATPTSSPLMDPATKTFRLGLWLRLARTTNQQTVKEIAAAFDTAAQFVEQSQWTIRSRQYSISITCA